MSDGPRPDGPLKAPNGKPPSCTSGLCATDACRDAEGTDIARGCRFYAAQLDNIDSADIKMMTLLLTNADQTTSATFRVELRSPDGWILVAPQDVVPANSWTRVEVNRPLVSDGLAPGGAFRITSDSPILVTQIISDDSDRASTSSSGTVLLPAHALDRHYMALTFREVGGQSVAAMPGSRNGAGVIAIVGTGDGTTVHLTPKIPTLIGGAIFYPGMPTSDYVVTLNEGDVLQAFSDLPDGDLSGTTIDSDQPVSVFSGNIFTTYGNAANGFNSGDMAIEQMPPLSGWGNEYVGARLAPQKGCDSFLQPGGAMWQVVAAQDARITITPSTGTDVIIGTQVYPMGTSFSLPRGQTSVFTTAPDASWTDPDPPPGDIIVFGDGPIMLAQWLDCEPGLSLGMDTRLGATTNITIAFPPGFQQEVIIVRRAEMPVQFDNYTIPPGYFQRISPNYEYEVARLTQDQFGDCLNDVDFGCRHNINSPLAGVALSWRGVDVVCSYSLTVPPSDPCVRPGCVQ